MYRSVKRLHTGDMKIGDGFTLASRKIHEVSGYGHMHPTYVLNSIEFDRLTGLMDILDNILPSKAG